MPLRWQFLQLWTKKIYRGCGFAIMTGLLDSGVGGLFLLKALCQKGAEKHFIYLADQKHFPYGEKSFSQVRSLVAKNVKFLTDQGACRVVVACNTATAVLKRENKGQSPNKSQGTNKSQSPVPVMGVISASLKQAEKDSQNGRVGVLATKGTVHSQAFLKEKEITAPHLNIYQSACPLLAPFVERVGPVLCSGGLTPAMKSRLFSLLDLYIPPLLHKGVDTIIMACTHYLYLKPMLEQYLPQGIKVVGPVDFLARDFLAVVQEKPQQSGKKREQKLSEEQTILPASSAQVQLFVSGNNTAEYRKKCRKILGPLFTVQEGGDNVPV